MSIEALIIIIIFIRLYIHTNIHKNVYLIHKMKPIFINFIWYLVGAVSCNLFKIVNKYIIYYKTYFLLYLKFKTKIVLFYMVKNQVIIKINSVIVYIRTIVLCNPFNIKTHVLNYLSSRYLPTNSTYSQL